MTVVVIIILFQKILPLKQYLKVSLTKSLGIWPKLWQIWKKNKLQNINKLEDKDCPWWFYVGTAAFCTMDLLTPHPQGKSILAQEKTRHMDSVLAYGHHD